MRPCISASSAGSFSSSNKSFEHELIIPQNVSVEVLAYAGHLERQIDLLYLFHP